MKYSYEEYVSIFKALADQTRLKIFELLAGDEMCACQVLENFKITQPTLSYHMKILCDSGLVKGRRDGAWMYYSNNGAVIEDLSVFLSDMISNQAKGHSKLDEPYSSNCPCK